MKLQVYVQTALLGAIAMVAWVGFTPEASAQDASVEVRTIEASRNGDEIDAKLSDLKGELNVAFAGYTSFRQLSVDRLALNQGEPKGVTLPNGADMTITFNGHAGEMVKLGLAIAGKMSTTLRITSGGTFFQAGMKHGDGILILAIKVE